MFCKIFIEFFLYSVLGWVYETIFCTVTTKKWDNRGMLFGPYCPIYGIGAVLCALICSNINKWIYVFLICMFGSAILEFTTAFITEKMFHAVWWDYTNFPLNYKGIICLPAATAFGCAGLLVKYVLDPIIKNFIGVIPVFLVEPIAMILIAVFAADIALTVDSLVSLYKKLEEAAAQMDSKISNKYDNLVVAIDSGASNAVEFVKSKISREHVKQDILEEEGNRLKPTLDWKQIKILHLVRTIDWKTKRIKIINYKDILNKLKSQIQK